jgi:hypothetical protein
MCTTWTNLFWIGDVAFGSSHANDFFSSMAPDSPDAGWATGPLGADFAFALGKFCMENSRLVPRAGCNHMGKSGGMCPALIHEWLS